MKRLVAGLVGIGLAVGFLFGRGFGTAEEKKGGPQIGHMVYFQLKESNGENKRKLVEACKKYLSGHPGTVYFSAGVLAEGLKREVNDRDWDVALHLVFKDQAAHDVYQDAAKHKQFIEENKAGWKKVRVFDSEIE
jgi:hypothetical protein